MEVIFGVSLFCPPVSLHRRHWCLVSVVQQASLYGLTGMFPVDETHAIMVGESVAGVFVSLSRLLTKGIFDTDRNADLLGLRVSIYVYFAISLGVIFVCWALFETTRKLSYCAHYVAKASLAQKQEVSSGSSWRGLIRRLLRPIAGVMLAFFGTYTLYPGVITSPSSQVLGDWYAVLLVANCCLFDFLGRIVSGWHGWLSYEASPKFARVMAASMARFLLIPLIVMCAAPKQSPLIQSEAVLFILTAILTCSGGYLGSTPMMLGPELVGHDEKELAGNILAFCLLLSISVGTTVAFLFGYLISL